MMSTSIYSLEELSCHILSIWQKYDNKPAGPPTQFTDYAMNVNYDMFRKKSMTFQEFFDGRHETGVTVDKTYLVNLFSWYSRMKLRWSCSSIAAIFKEMIIPRLKQSKLTIGTEPNTQVIDVAGARICHLLFKPNGNYTFRFEALGEVLREENIEFYMDVLKAMGLAGHNFLLLTDDSIIDFTLGQFTGDLHQPRHYKSFQEFSTFIPGKIEEPFTFVSEESIREQIQNDRDCFKMGGRNKSAEDFVSDIFSSLSAGWAGICGNCYNATSTLRKCMKCGKQWYCGKQCQTIHWRKKHKNVCCEK